MCWPFEKGLVSLLLGASLGTISIQAQNTSGLNSNENMSSFTEILLL